MLDAARGVWRCLSPRYIQSNHVDIPASHAASCVVVASVKEVKVSLAGTVAGNQTSLKSVKGAPFTGQESQASVQRFLPSTENDFGLCSAEAAPTRRYIAASPVDLSEPSQGAVFNFLQTMLQRIDRCCK